MVIPVMMKNDDDADVNDDCEDDVEDDCEDDVDAARKV